MKPLTEIYKEKFFTRRYKLSWRAPVFCDAVQSCLRFDSYIDVGCAIGDIVAEFQRRNVDACGIEGSEHCVPYLEATMVHIMDVRLPISMGRTYDLVTCLEVVEHIEPEYEEQLIQNLVNLTGVWLLISAAPPGQRGHYHVNCQPHSYWEQKFKEKGLIKHDVGTQLIKDRLEPWKQKDGIKAFYKNLLLFRDER